MGRLADIRRRSGPALVLFAGLGIVIACYSPTEARLDIQTDADCARVRGTSIYVNGNSIAETTACTTEASANSIGDFVLTPDGARDGTVTIEVDLAFDTANPQICKPGVTRSDCISSRRTFSFSKHNSIHVPVNLYIACAGVDCGADQTCIGANNPEGHACINVDQPPDVPQPPLDKDGGGGKDSGPVLDAAKDAISGTKCLGSNGDDILAAGVGRPGAGTKIVASATTLYWIAADKQTVYSLPKHPSAGVKVSVVWNTNSTILAIAPVTATSFGARDALFISTTGGIYRLIADDSGDAGLPTPVPNQIAKLAAANKVFAGTPIDVQTCSLTGGPFTELPDSGDAHAAIAANNVLLAYTDGNKLKRHSLGVFTFGDAVVPNVVDLDLASEEVSYRTMTDVGVVRQANVTPTSFASVTSSTGEVATEGGRTFWTDGGGPGNPVGTAGVWSSDGITKASHVTGLVDIVGLVVDVACIYYWGAATSGAGGTGNNVDAIRSVAR